MAAHESAAMVKARKLITVDGMSAYAAAAKVGLTRSAIYMAPWYKAWKFEQQTRDCTNYPGGRKP